MPRKSPLASVSSDKRAVQASKKTAISPASKIKLRKSSVRPLPKHKAGKFSIKNLLVFIKDNVFYLIIPLTLLFSYLYKLKSLPPIGMEGSLSVSHNSLSSIDTIDFLPIKMLIVGFEKLGFSNPIDIRVLNVLLCLISILLFYKIISGWLGGRMGGVSVLLYGLSTWSIAQSRHDSEFIMLALFIPFLLFFGNMLISSGSTLLRLTSAVVLAQFIFVPGAVWFMLISLIVYFVSSGKQTRTREFLLPVLTMILVWLGYVALIFYLSLTSWSQVFRLLGVQVGELPSWSIIRTNMTELPSQLFISGVNDSSFWLFKTPIIDWVTLIFVVTGFIYMIKKTRTSLRVKYLFFILLLSISLVCLNGPFYISLILPAIYIIAAIGIDYLIRRWLNIFPNNPIARSIGIFLICTTVLLSCAYHMERYFIGWPKTNAYQELYKS